MGLSIHQKGNLYQLESTVCDDRIHNKEWITEEEAKKLLIERHLIKFYEEVIKVDMEFPSGYSCDGKRIHIKEKHGSGINWICDNYRFVDEKAKSILKRLGI